MIKLRRAVFCYYILGFDGRLHQWLVMISYSVRIDGLLAIDSAERKKIANWISNLFNKKLDFDTILHVLSGDAFFEQNKIDVRMLETETGRRVTDLWDTDPIFDKYPNLRRLGRNKEFEKMWVKIKSQIGENQK